MHISVPGVRLRGWLFNLLQETPDWTHRYRIQFIMWTYLVSGRSALLKNLSILMFALGQLLHHGHQSIHQGLKNAPNVERDSAKVKSCNPTSSSAMGCLGRSSLELCRTNKPTNKPTNPIWTQTWKQAPTHQTLKQSTQLWRRCQRLLLPYHPVWCHLPPCHLNLWHPPPPMTPKSTSMSTPMTSTPMPVAQPQLVGQPQSVGQPHRNAGFLNFISSQNGGQVRCPYKTTFYMK